VWAKPADKQIEPQTIYLYLEKDNLQYVCKKSSKNETILIDQSLAIYKNIEELIKMQITKNATLPLPTEYMTEFFKFISKYDHSFIDSNLLKKLKNTIDSKGNIQDLKNLCIQMIAFAKQDHLFLVSQCISKRARNACFNVLHKLQLSSATNNEQTIKAIKFMLNKANNKGSTLNVGDLDLSFIPVAWQKIIFAKSQEQEVIKDHFEACILSEAVNEFRAGDLITTNSELFSGYKSQLLSKEECSSKINDYCNAINISATGPEGVKSLKEQLLSTAKQLDDDCPNVKGFTIDNKGNPILSKPKAKSKNNTTSWLKTQIKMRIKEKHILDVLCSTNHLTGWANNFGHVSGVAGRIDNSIEKYILATFSAATGLGPTQTVKHFKSSSNFEVTPHTLSWIIRRHISIAKLGKAIIALNNEINQYQVVSCWGDGKSCAADGTLRNIYEANLLAEYHLRSGARGGIAYYHIANNYIAFFASFIPCGVWEAIAILEGLLQNKSEVQPDTVHADTQGQSSVVFALAYLLGIKLMPRIRNWKEYTMFKADKAVVYTNIESLFTRVIDWNLIEECWDDFMQVVLSIKAGTISTTFLLQQLTNYARKNKLLKGLQELGHVIRTLFLIEYLSKIELRAEITATTNTVTYRSEPQMKDFYKYDGGWWFKTIGKGNKERSIPVSDELLKALKRYRKTLDLPALPSPQEETPLLPKQKGKGAITSSKTIRNMVQICFNRAIERMDEEGFNEEAETLKSATVHWLRHTGISNDVKFRPREHVRDDAGHSSSAITDKYIDIDLRERYLSAKNKKIKVN